MTFNIDWGYTLSVVVIGLVVVFAVLAVLVLICTLMGKFFQSIDNKKNNTSGTSSDKTPEPVKAVAKPATPKPAPIKAVGIPNDVVAAISAAIATVMGSDNGFTIKSIKRTGVGGTKQIGRPAWRNAGISDNTRPF